MATLKRTLPALLLTGCVPAADEVGTIVLAASLPAVALTAFVSWLMHLGWRRIDPEMSLDRRIFLGGGAVSLLLLGCATVRMSTHPVERGDLELGLLLVPCSTAACALVFGRILRAFGERAAFSVGALVAWGVGFAPAIALAVPLRVPEDVEAVAFSLWMAGGHPLVVGGILALLGLEIGARRRWRLGPGDSMLVRGLAALAVGALLVGPVVFAVNEEGGLPAPYLWDAERELPCRYTRWEGWDHQARRLDEGGGDGWALECVTWSRLDGGECVEKEGVAAGFWVCEVR